MALQITNISEITPEKESWIINARVVRLWTVPDFNRPNISFSLEIVLVDSHGSRIHASVRKTLIYKFQRTLQEGCVYKLQNFGVATNGGHYRTTHHQYKINFLFNTNVQLIDAGVVQPQPFDFVPLTKIQAVGFDTDYLVDIMGLMTGVGTERQIVRDGTKTKLNVISVEADCCKIECSLFGKYVDQLNTFLSSEEIQSVIVIIQLAKTKSFQGKMQLQNCIECTKIIFNPTCEEAQLLKKRLNETMDSPSQTLTQLTEISNKINISEDFLQLTPRITIRGLKKSEEECSYIVNGTITHIADNDDWWYSACVCNKAVYPDEKMFFCEKCNRHVMKVVPRYRLKVRVTDQTDSATFVIFDRDATMLLNKSCAELFDLHCKESQKCNSDKLPNEISKLLHKTFLFKVDFKEGGSSKFEKNFTVKKICTDPKIIKEFDELYCEVADPNSVGLFLTDGKTNVKEKFHEETSVVIVEDLMPKFNVESNDGESQVAKVVEIEGCDLIDDIEDKTPKKRKLPIEELPLKMLKKNIKIEKP